MKKARNDNLDTAFIKRAGAVYVVEKFGDAVHGQWYTLFWSPDQAWLDHRLLPSVAYCPLWLSRASCCTQKVCSVPLLDIMLIFQVYEDSVRSMSLFSIDHDHNEATYWCFLFSWYHWTIAVECRRHPAPMISSTLLELHLRRLRTWSFTFVPTLARWYFPINRYNLIYPFCSPQKLCHIPRKYN